MDNVREDVNNVGECVSVLREDVNNARWRIGDVCWRVNNVRGCVGILREKWTCCGDGNV